MWLRSLIPALGVIVGAGCDCGTLSSNQDGAPDSDSSSPPGSDASDASGTTDAGPPPATCSDPWVCTADILLGDGTYPTALAYIRSRRVLGPAVEPAVLDVAGDCTVYQGTWSQEAERVYLEIGELSITGASAYPDITFTRTEYGFYQGDVPFGATDLFTGGDVLELTLSGGALFGDLTDTLVAPTDMDVTAPFLPGGNPLTIDRASDLNVTWSVASSPGDYAGVIISSDLDDTFVECLVADAGVATVTANQLSYLAAGPGSFLVSRSVLHALTTSMGYDVAFWASSDVFEPAMLE